MIQAGVQEHEDDKTIEAAEIPKNTRGSRRKFEHI